MRKREGGEREGREMAGEGSKERDGRMRGVEVKGEGRRAFIILLCSYPFLANRVFASWYRDKCLHS